MRAGRRRTGEKPRAEETPRSPSCRASPAAARARSTSCATSPVRAIAGRTKSTQIASNCASSSRGAERCRERLARGGAEQVDGVAETRLGRRRGGEPLARRCRWLGQLQSLGLAGVGAEDAEAAGIGQHRDARAGRQGLRREQGRGVQQLRERAHPLHARLMEERVDRRLGARERGGVGGGGTCTRGARRRP